MWIAVVASFAAAAPAPSQPPDVALRAGSVGFDRVTVLSSTADGSLLIGGTRWGAFDVGALALPSVSPADDFNARMRAPSGGFLARVDLDGTARFVVGPDLGAHVDAAAELADGRIFVAGVVRARPARFRTLTLAARGDDLVGYGAFVSARGAPERAVSFGASGNVWVSAAAAAGDGVVVVGSFDGALGGSLEDAASGGARRAFAATNGPVPYSDGFVLALASDGAPRWSARVGSPDFTDGADRVITLADGTLLVTGTVGRQVVFEDGQGRRASVRCGDPVSCPFLWALDPTTGATRFHNVLKNGSGMPDAVAVAATPDGGFVVGGGMGRNLRVGSAVERRRRDEVKLRANDAVGSSWLARFAADGSLRWARRVDVEGSSLRALAIDRDAVVLVGTGDLGLETGVMGAPTAKGEGPATLARVRLADGAHVDAVRFGRPRDAPLTKSEDNLRVGHVVVTRDGRLAFAGEIEERAWLNLSSGPVELVSAGATSPHFANESDVFLAIVRDPRALAAPALPSSTNARVDPFEGCVARRGGALLVPCAPRASEGRREIHHSCIDGLRRVGDRRTWACGALDDEIPLEHDGLELMFLERVPGGRLALYHELVGTGACGGRARMACRMTARLLDGDGGAQWSHALERALGGASDTRIAEVRLDGDTLFVVESCWGYELGHRGRCDQLVALDAPSGRVRWRSPPLTVHGAFAIVDDLIVGFSPGTHGTSKSKRRAARLVALDRKTGAVRGEVPAADVIALDALAPRADGARVRVTSAPLMVTPHTTRELVLVNEGGRVRMTLR